MVYGVSSFHPTSEASSMLTRLLCSKSCKLTAKCQPKASVLLIHAFAISHNKGYREIEREQANHAQLGGGVARALHFTLKVVGEKPSQGGGRREGEASQGDLRRKPVSDPPHLSTFCPSPPLLFLLRTPLEIPTSGDPSETAFGESPRTASKAPSSPGFALRCVLPPLQLSQNRERESSSRFESLLGGPISPYLRLHTQVGQPPCSKPWN